MVQVFESAIQQGFFPDEDAAMMLEAYIEAAAAWELTNSAARRHLAIILQKLARLEHFPGISALSTLAVEWYLSGRPVDGKEEISAGEDGSSSVLVPGSTTHKR